MSGCVGYRTNQWPRLGDKGVTPLAGEGVETNGVDFAFLCINAQTGQ